MRPFSVIVIALVCGFAASTTACSRSGKQTAPAAEIQAQTPVQQPNQPMTVVGCVKAGEATDTFVLTTARTTTGEQTATYQLLGGHGEELRNQVGRRAEISGVLTAQQQTVSLSPTATADKAKGTGGTPTVSTRTDIEMRRLDVQSVRPLGDRCDM
jgi:hypothetical protein